ncbi:hypothetical protein TNCV_4574771 [Trichonephila clavipes]|nr:hypothetical protein TNCV_4574771 [Trichonephila clavipes]
MSSSPSGCEDLPSRWADVFWDYLEEIVTDYLQMDLKAALVEWSWSRTRGRCVMSSSPSDIEDLPSRWADVFWDYLEVM